LPLAWEQAPDWVIGRKRKASGVSQERSGKEKMAILGSLRSPNFFRALRLASLLRYPFVISPWPGACSQAKLRPIAQILFNAALKNVCRKSQNFFKADKKF